MLFRSILVLALLFSLNLGAHQLSESKVNIYILEKEVKIKLTLPLDRLIIALKHLRLISQDIYEFDSRVNINKVLLQNYIKTRVIISSNNIPWETEITKIKKSTTHKGIYEVLISSKPQKNSNIRNFSFFYDVILKEIATHRAIIVLSQDLKNGIFYEDIVIGKLKFENKSIEISDEKIKHLIANQKKVSFFNLGAEFMFIVLGLGFFILFYFVKGINLSAKR